MFAHGRLDFVTSDPFSLMLEGLLAPKSDFGERAIFKARGSAGRTAFFEAPSRMCSGFVLISFDRIRSREIASSADKTGRRESLPAGVSTKRRRSILDCFVPTENRIGEIGEGIFAWPEVEIHDRLLCGTYAPQIRQFRRFRNCFCSRV